ncbi:helix-turn-helix domain-containing protein [Clostridium sp. MD294]|uniref:helix-turn-helix domain-containing protein n=1 Tax=Clostridium sp. MD294 TaxID=97138 RepID=UPI0002CAE6F1|nr:helix-turn-helix domain-containing protein [Clostridium sp. MD294]NDO46016.1 hypothetical protein [Clostridium sp. MD294]USF30320.1 hypothetical protein C820_001761 [Clostridium sp. MD294]
MYITQEIADKIKSQAKLKKITMKELLFHCELNINAISEFAKGKQLSCLSLARIADYLDCSVDYLLGRTDDCTKIKNSTILTKKIKDTNIESDIIEDTFVMGTNIENTNIGKTNKKNDTEQTINENEAELLKVYRSLSFRDKHELMSIIYKMEDKATKA